MALLNLSMNARDAMPDGGTLRLSAISKTLRAGSKPGLRGGGYICLSVADTGMGMDESTRVRAIEPFFSTKGIGKGTGLGLSMVHGLASQLGGALTITSEPGLGTNVELWLPQSSDDVERQAAPSSIEAARGQGTVLVVDDEEFVRLSISDMLNDLGYHVVEATSAEEALLVLEGQPSASLIITDHLMPDMTGTEFAATLRSRGIAVPILMVSGYAETEGISPEFPLLTKPFRKDELAAAIAELPPAVER